MVGSDRAKNLGLVRKSRFWTNFKMAENFFQGGNEIGDSHFVLMSQGLQGYKTLESTTSGLGVMSRFASVVAIAPPMGQLG